MAFPTSQVVESPPNTFSNFGTVNHSIVLDYLEPQVGMSGVIRATFTDFLFNL